MSPTLTPETFGTGEEFFIDIRPIILDRTDKDSWQLRGLGALHGPTKGSDLYGRDTVVMNA